MNDFICPNCGSTKEEGRILLSKEPVLNKKRNAWASVLEQVTCKDCRSIIPTHLAERWNNISIDEAKKEWANLYKKDNQRQKI